jgi:type II secretory pathway pseudopilin PulG
VRHPTGWTLPESLAIVAVVGLALAVTLPAVHAVRDAARAEAGARLVATTLQALRWKSVAGNRGHGLLFARDAVGWKWWEVADGNDNGLSISEIEDGTDLTASGPRRLEDHVAHVTFGFPPTGPFPRIPPAKGKIANLDDPIQIGNTNLLALNPLGTATGGTLYVTDGRARLYAVVVFGPTGRIRVWRLDPWTRQWKR